MGALAEPVSIPLRVSLFVFGAVALLFACFGVWKKEHDKAKKAIDLLRVSHQREMAVAKTTSSIDELRQLIDHLRNYDKWLAIPGTELFNLALEEIGSTDEEIKTILGAEFPAKLDEYLQVYVSMPKDENFAPLVCAMRLKALTSIIRQLNGD